MKKLLFSTSVVSTSGSAGLLLIRVVFGLSMALAHGWGKLTNFGDLSTKFLDFLGLGSTVSLALAVFAEFFCALLVAAGLLTRAALVPLVVTMCVAAFLVHGEDPFADKEMAVLYLSAFVALLLAGPGKYSVDHHIR